jgi:hypothetical protein
VNDREWKAYLHQKKNRFNISLPQIHLKKGGMKAVALVVSARKHGNCHDCAHFVLSILEKEGINTELIHFCDYQITPCQNCTYECVQEFDLEMSVNQKCPLQDDVKTIWEKTWKAEIVLFFVPTYGGLPPAVWVAFTQRQQGILEKPAAEKLENFLVGAVVFASPHFSGIAERTPSVIADHIRNMGRKVVGFEVINNAGFETENLFGGLINEKEIQRRLTFLAKGILKAVKEK